MRLPVTTLAVLARAVPAVIVHPDRGLAAVVAGVDEVTGGDVAITADVALLGAVTCTPIEPRPAGETLSVR